MTKWPIQLRSIRLTAILAIVWIAPALHAAEKIRRPTEPELERLVGQRLSRPVKDVKWQAAEPPNTNLLIYAIQPRQHSPEFLVSLARFLGVRGEPQKIPSTMLDGPGLWIKEPNPTNKTIWKCVYVSERSGTIGFSSGEDNHRWDVKSHKPTATGVPDEPEAMRRTLELLPALGISTNDLEHLPDGRLKYASNTEGTTYNDRTDDWKQKRYIRQINVELWQRIQNGASVLSIGGGGMLRVGYLSEGRLAEFEMTFRQVKPVGNALPKTSKELVKMLQRGEVTTFRPYIPDKLTITNCALVYPQANSYTKQDFLWPFYALDAVGVADGQTNWFRLYQPLSW